jgi:SAM-dependent methyltransferase
MRQSDSRPARSAAPAPEAGRRRALAALCAPACLRGLALSSLSLAGCGAWERLPIRTPDAPFVVTREDLVLAMLKMAGVGAADNVYDLGCGDGRIPIAAARQFGARGVGTDLDAALIRIARTAAAQAGVAERVEFRVEDLFETGLRPATVVTLYLLPEMLERLEPRLRSQLRPGSRVVSHQFKIGGDWPPQQTLELPGAVLYLWRL